jgi:hypothetical protein
VNFALRAKNHPARVRLRMRWGPWKLERFLQIADPEGVSCIFGKGNDGLSIPVFVSLDHYASATFGVGTLLDR